MEVPKISLGRTEVKIPPLGVGTWQWGDKLYWGFGRGYDENDLYEAFQKSLKAGVDFFDTAEVYGMGLSERFLGTFIQKMQVQVVIATKFMPWHFQRGSLMKSLRASLKRLGLPQVALYQVHWPIPLRRVEVWAEALADAVEAGLTRAVGVSNFSLQQMRRAYDVLSRRGIPLASNQVEYSLLNRKVEWNGLLRACEEMGVTLIAYSPLGMGILTGKYTLEHPPSGFRNRRYGRRLLARVEPLIHRLREIGEAHGGKTPAQVALNWVMCKGAVPIPGAKNALQAQENAGAIGWSLTPEEVARLDEASQNL